MLFRSLFNFAALAGLASSASLKQVTSFGSNPTGLQMYIYVPDKLAAEPAVIVAVSQKEEGLMDFTEVLTLRHPSCTLVGDRRPDGTPAPSSLHTPISLASSSSTPARPR